MKPEIMPGDFIIAKEVDFETIAIGDDVIYYSKAKDIFIVHRVIAVNEDGSLTMKGINNPVQDEEVVTIDNYIGKVIKHGSFLNLGNIVINKRFVIFTIIFLIFAILFITEMVKIVRTMKEKENLRLQTEYQNKLAAEIQKERERITAEIKEEIDKKI
jgi:signal peptidase I